LEIVGPNELYICSELSLSLGGWGISLENKRQCGKWEREREREGKAFQCFPHPKSSLLNF
jgi:hypothetical protein